MQLSSRIKDIRHALSQWNPEDPPAVAWLVEELRGLLGADFAGSYRPAIIDRGWSIEWMVGAGPTALTHIHAFRDCVARLPESDSFFAYNPYVVESRQRNRALRLRNLPRGIVAEANESILREVGVAGQDQMRVLLCDGPRLLSWLGVTRSKRFTKRELDVFDRVTRPMRQRLRFEQEVRRTKMRTAALETALEALGRAAFVVGPRHTIEAVNARANALLEGGSRRVLDSLRDSQRRPSTAAAFSIVPLALRGCPAHVLAIEKDPAPSLADRVSLAASQWKLTSRQARVLSLLATGITNKEIAAELRCATVTVENHVTELFRRSGARSRVDLVSRLFAPGAVALGQGPGGRR